jgi:hypothetical protein
MSISKKLLSNDLLKLKARSPQPQTEGYILLFYFCRATSGQKYEMATKSETFKDTNWDELFNHWWICVEDEVIILQK